MFMNRASWKSSDKTFSLENASSSNLKLLVEFHQIIVNIPVEPCVVPCQFSWLATGETCDANCSKAGDPRLPGSMALGQAHHVDCSWSGDPRASRLPCQLGPCIVQFLNRQSWSKPAWESGRPGFPDPRVIHMAGLPWSHRSWEPLQLLSETDILVSFTTANS